MRQNCLILLVLTISVSLYGQPVKYSSFQRGLDLYEKQMYNAAQFEFDKAHTNEMELLNSEKLDFYKVMCAAQLSQQSAEHEIEDFIITYPNSIYLDQINIMLGHILYMRGDYVDASNKYLAIDGDQLQDKDDKNEYYFRLGHSLFNCQEYDKAYKKFRRVDENSKYSSHVKYHTAYMDYIKGNYNVAKSQFAELSNEEAYSDIIPYYILQIEFLQNNHQYVVDNGAELLSAVHGERAKEIARVLAQSWFNLGDYSKALDYILTYKDLGGNMGRQEMYVLGFCTYRMKNYDKAVASLQKACGPNDALTQNAAYHLADCFLRMGDRRKAIASFSMASEAKFDKVIAEDALYNYGKLQYELGGGVFNEAINVLQKYIETYPESVRIEKVREYLVSAYYNSKNFEAAYDAIQLIPDPDNNVRAAMQKITYFRALEFFNEGDDDKAYELLSKSANNRFNPKYTALASFWMAEILYRKEAYKEAVLKYKIYMRLSPDSEKEHILTNYSLGYCYFNMQDWANVISYMEKFLAEYSKPDSYRADALNRLGDAYFSATSYVKALDTYNLVSKLGTPERFYAQYQKAIMQGLTKQVPAKIESLNAMITAGNGDYVDDAMYELGRTYLRLERYKEGANTLERFVQRYPSSHQYINAISELGLVYENLGDEAKAMKYYKMVVGTSPNSTKAKDAMIGLKGMYVNSNDVDGYVEFVEKSGVVTEVGAVERDSLSFSAVERLYASGNSKAKVAIADYLQDFEKGIFVPNALYYYYVCQLRDKEVDGAITTLQKLTSLYHNEYTVRGLEKLSALSFDNKKYDISRDAYKRLSEVAVNPTKSSKALEGYLHSVELLNDDDATLEACAYVISAPSSTVEVRNLAKFAKAKIFTRKGDTALALAIYEELSAKPKTAYGAESAYMVIEDRFNKKKYDETEKLVIALSGANTSHSYWLGKAFIILGDTYVAKKDIFQARATLQSIVDGYSPSDDGVVEAALERIKNLETLEKEAQEAASAAAAVAAAKAAATVVVATDDVVPTV